MPSRCNINENRILKYVALPRIKQLCPKELLYFKKYQKNIVFLIYKTNDITFPDVAKITNKFYGRPMVEYYYGYDTVDNLEKFLNYNIKSRDELANMVQELSILPTVDNIKLEEIFDDYMQNLGPSCQLYKLIYYLSCVFYALDMRHYEGKPTFLKRSLTVVGIIRWLRGQISKKEVLNMWPKVLETVGPTDRIEKVSHAAVDQYDKELSSERFIHKKGEIISVRPYVKLIKTLEDKENDISGDET